ncbi:MAG: hypothetical protein SV775_11230 [Thermodesulfobacteriota bacterium]|nr:hypothetical protein [Thermodesulfobacteriota bacterium]
MSKKHMTGISIVVVLIVIYLGVKMYASNVAEGKVNEAIAKAANFADIDYGKVSVDLLGMDVRVSDIIVSPANAKDKVEIDEIIIHDIDDQADIPTFLSVSCNGIELNVEDLGEDTKPLRELGYNDKMMVNLNVNYAYNKEKKEIDIKKIGIGANEAGEINVSFRLGNISLEPEEIAGLLFTFQQVILHEVRICYDDDSLTERLMRLAAKEKQVSLEDFKKSLIEDVEKEIAKENDEFTQKALSEIKKFLADPDEFSISASPSKPHSLGRIMRTNDPKEVIKLLNIQITS